MKTKWLAVTLGVLSLGLGLIQSQNNASASVKSKQPSYTLTNVKKNLTTKNTVWSAPVKTYIGSIKGIKLGTVKYHFYRNGRATSKFYPVNKKNKNNKTIVYKFKFKKQHNHQFLYLKPIHKKGNSPITIEVLASKLSAKFKVTGYYAFINTNNTSLNANKQFDN